MITTNLQNSCWLWAGNCKPNGYGRLWDSVASRYVYAHRLMYENTIGKIPEKLQLDHLCRNTTCINPEHLEPVTQRENIFRGEGVAVKNAAKFHCIRKHSLSGENLIIEKRGGRKCRKCARDYAREYYHSKRKLTKKEG
jgi:hypothetical protein